jgi:hypothetical protein
MEPNFMKKYPTRGETWQHYKGGLYTIVGLSRDDHGKLSVIYCNHRSVKARLFDQPIGRFLQEVEHDKPRFVFIPDEPDKVCPYINYALPGDQA